MMCYRDKTFCSSSCVRAQCYRYFDMWDSVGAFMWMGDDAPIAYSDFSAQCPDYEPPEREKSMHDFHLEEGKWWEKNLDALIVRYPANSLIAYAKSHRLTIPNKLQEAEKLQNEKAK